MKVTPGKSLHRWLIRFLILNDNFAFEIAIRDTIIKGEGQICVKTASLNQCLVSLLQVVLKLSWVRFCDLCECWGFLPVLLQGVSIEWLDRSSLHWASAQQDEPLAWSSQPTDFPLHIPRGKTFWVVTTFSNFPCQTHRTLIQLPDNQSFPAGCFVWLLGQLYFCNYQNNYKNKTVRQAAQILKAHVCVWGCG